MLKVSAHSVVNTASLCNEKLNILPYKFLSDIVYLRTQAQSNVLQMM